MKDRKHPAEPPQIIEAYWTAANAGDSKRASGCFSPDATIYDEGGIYRGRPAIAAWIEETTQKYHPVVEALRWEEKEDRCQVMARVTGSFPGSPIELEYDFTLKDREIMNLKIQ